MTTTTRTKFLSLLDSNPTEARDFILREGYAKRKPSKGARELFAKHFPVTDTFKKEKKGSLRDLRSSDREKQLKAAKYLVRRACGNWTGDAKCWLADPRTADILLDALAVTPTAVQALIVDTLGLIVERYSYYDLRIRDCLVSMFEGSEDEVRLEIAGAICPFRDKEVWEIVLRGFDCQPKPKTRLAERLGMIARHQKLIRSKPRRRRLYDRVLAAASSSRNIDAVSNWCMAAFSLRQEDTQKDLLTCVDPKFHELVRKWANRNVQD